MYLDAAILNPESGVRTLAQNKKFKIVPQYYLSFKFLISKFI